MLSVCTMLFAEIARVLCSKSIAGSKNKRFRIKFGIHPIGSTARVPFGLYAFQHVNKEACFKYCNAVDCEKLQMDLDRWKRSVVPHSCHLNGASIPTLEIVRDLDVMLDYRHLDHISHRSYKMLGFLHKSAKCFRQIEALKVLYFVYVRSVMKYTALIRSSAYVTHIAQMESVQRCF